MKTRFSPSPTGSMHIGNVRTALFSALYAKAHHGQFLLRIEDTDRERSETRYERQIYDDMHWLGLEWQEGPDKNQGNGPYRQSERQDIYDKYYGKLQESGAAYPCFCTEQELAIARKTQLAAGKPPRYTGKCAGLSKAEIDAKIQSGLKPCLRFRLPTNHMIEFIDLVKGAQRFNSDDIGDFIIRRADGTSPFMFCNAVDDALMGVTHVVRGDDHVTNTPRQILILEALGLNLPQYAHVSMIIGFDGAPLSKRHGSSSLTDLKNAGFLPQAIMNYLARLGHPYDNQLLTFDELARSFDLEHISASPAKFDEKQLEHWQKEAVQYVDSETLWQWMGESVHSIVPTELKNTFIAIVRPNVLLPDDAFYWADVLFHAVHPIDENEMIVLKEAGENYFSCAVKAVNKFGMDYKAVMAMLKDELKLKGKALFMPLRIALTGEMHGPELIHVFELLGKDELVKRLKAVS